MERWNEDEEFLLMVFCEKSAVSAQVVLEIRRGFVVSIRCASKDETGIFRSAEMGAKFTGQLRNLVVY